MKLPCLVLLRGFQHEGDFAEEGFGEGEEVEGVEEAVQPAGGDAEIAGEGGGVVDAVMVGGENNAMVLKELNESWWRWGVCPFVELVGEEYAEHKEI